MQGPKHLAETEKIEGKKPRRFDDFVKETAAAWKQEATTGMKVGA